MIEKRHAGRLPHWRLAGGLYFVTFRLYDALPDERVVAIKEWVDHEERRESERLGRPLTQTERVRVRQRSTGRLDRALDEGHGECLLRRPGAAALVEDVVRRGKGYRLYAWAVMPNHVHALVRPDPEASLSRIVGAWKSISARTLADEFGVVPPLWQRESFDHLVRNEEKAREYARYIEENPRKARLTNWPYLGVLDDGYADVVWPFEETTVR